MRDCVFVYVCVREVYVCLNFRKCQRKTNITTRSSLIEWKTKQTKIQKRIINWKDSEKSGLNSRIYIALVAAVAVLVEFCLLSEPNHRGREKNVAQFHGILIRCRFNPFGQFQANFFRNFHSTCLWVLVAVSIIIKAIKMTQKMKAKSTRRDTQSRFELCPNSWNDSDSCACKIAVLHGRLKSKRELK